MWDLGKKHREEQREREKARQRMGRLEAPVARLVFSFCYSLEHHRALKEFPRRSKFKEIKV